MSLLSHLFFTLTSVFLVSLNIVPLCFPCSCLFSCFPPIFLILHLRVPGVGMPLLWQIAREAEAAMFHRQVFEDLRRSTPYCKDPAEAIAIGAVEASFKSLASAIIVLTGSGR